MSGETGQLQRLTDEQVNARLAAYNGDGSLERDVKLLREKVGDMIDVRESATSSAPKRADAPEDPLFGQGRRGLGPGGRRIRPSASSASARRFPNISMHAAA